MRYFNTAGVCLPDLHYMLPPEPRLPEARPLIEQGQYFVVHAPRQTGKTTALLSLARSLTAGGQYAALLFSGETAQAAGDDYDAAERQVLDSIRFSAAGERWPAELCPPDPWPEAPAGRRLGTGLAAWAQRCPLPLVLFFDEIDALMGQSLISVLRQLRDGFRSRPARFPHSVVLCGLRDVRDYKAASGGDPTRLGTASPFNIKVASLRLGDFTFADVRELYGQHTTDTGQAFTEAALERAYAYTQGQPWLVNALARDLTWQERVPLSETVTAEHVDEAKERLILARQTHLDSLVDKLNEPRVRRVMEPLIAGELPETDTVYNDDVSYLRDLGLIAKGKEVRIANPIYREVVVRVLGESIEGLISDEDTRGFVRPDGRLDFRRLLAEFAEFWCQHGEILARRGSYHEAASQLVMMGYLHRIVNGGGYVDREYGLGRGRIDLCVRWPYRNADGKREWQHEAVELKVWRTGRRDPVGDGLKQLDMYLDRLGLDRGALVVFDQRDGAPPPHERTAFSEERTRSGRPVTLLRA